MERSRIRRALPLTAAWVVAAAIAVAVASQGVSLVGREVTDQRPASLSAAEIGERLDRAADTSTTASSAVPERDGSTTTSSTTTAAPPDRGSAGATPTTATPGAAVPTTAPAPPATTAPPPPTASPETRTYALVGGTVALRFASTGVTVVYATPAAGFEVDVEPEHGNGVKVEFESADHRSRVDGWWENGPVDRVREDDDEEDD